MLAASIFVACDKPTTEVPVIEQPVSREWEIEQGFVHFTTEEDFNTVVNDWGKIQKIGEQKGFSEFGANERARKGKNSENIPEKLAKILNEDGILQIGRWIFKMDFSQKVVFVIDEKNKSKLLSSLIEGKKGENVYQFSFEDEILQLLETGAKESIPNPPKNGRVALFCQSPGIGGTNHSDCKTIPQGQIGAGILVCASNQYDKYGIYFEAFALLKVQSPDNPSTFVIQNYDMVHNWENNCGKTGWDSFAGRSFGFDNNAGEWRSKHWVYTGTRGLRKLYLDVKWRYATLLFYPAIIDKP